MPHTKHENPQDSARNAIEAARANLPCPRTTRWVPRRKAEVVSAVASGVVTVNEVCTMYRMSIDEFASWARAFDASGAAATATR